MQPAIVFEILLLGAETMKKDVGKRVKELRKALGLTQEQFAAKVGVSFSTVNRWENGKGKPSPLAMKRIENLQNEFGQRNIS
jgi:transcriptional regulator with XRE-family HTH domain